MTHELHGQHLVADAVVRTLKGHVLNANPSKALVLSFHGWTGNVLSFHRFFGIWTVTVN